MPDLRKAGIWRPRNAAVFDFLRRHSATVGLLVEFFGGRTLGTRKKKAYRWICKQRKRGRVRVIGVAQRRDTGRPEIVYGRRAPRDKLEHELRVAEFALFFKDSPMERGLKVGRAEPDGIMVIDGRRCAVEVDNSAKMSAKQMQAKWKRYEGAREFILVVAVLEERMQRLRRGAELVKDQALFTTFERLAKGEPWVDFAGKEVTI